MSTIYGNELKSYTVTEVWDVGDWGLLLPSVHHMGKGESDRQIVLDNTHLRYEEYGVDISENEVRVWGSYRSFVKALNKFMELLWSDNDLTAADSLRGTIEIPKCPLKDKEDLRQLLEYLMKDEKFIYGQHMACCMNVDTIAGGYTMATGQGPAILDFEMVQLCDRPRGEWSRVLCQLVEYAAKGGLIATMHHWYNPYSPVNGSTWGRIESKDAWNAIITRGSEPNMVFHKYLDMGAEFLGALQAAGVPFMFRPMFEANGGWFWYGLQDGIDSEDVVNLWKYVYRYYTDECGLTNLLWTYAPAFTDLKVEEKGSVKHSVKSYYPGDDYCDIVGCDWYTGGDYEIDSHIYDGKSYDRLAEYGKPVCLAEWGVDGNGHKKHLNSADFVETFDQMRREGKSLAFIEVYNDSFGAPMTVGRGEAIRDYPYIIPLEDMPAYIAEALGK